MKIGLHDNKIYDDDDPVTVKRKFDAVLEDIRDHVELEVDGSCLHLRL